jgi:hypothetical protein
MKRYQGTGTNRVRRNEAWEHLPISRWVEERWKWGNRQCYVTLPTHIRKVSMSQVSHGHVMKRKGKSGKNHNSIGGKHISMEEAKVEKVKEWKRP